MAESVGLKIKQFSRIRTGHTYIFNNNINTLTTEISVDKYKLLKDRTNNDLQNRYSMGMVSTLSLNKNMSFNLIIDLLSNENTGRRNSISNMACLLNARLNYETPKSKWIILPAFRFYGINYISENYESSYFGSEQRYFYQILKCAIYEKILDLSSYF